MTGPATNVITTVDELKAAEAAADAIVVGYFAADTPENDTALSEFVKTARMDINDIFYQTSIADVAEAAGATLNAFSVISNFKVHLPLTAPKPARGSYVYAVTAPIQLTIDFQLLHHCSVET